MRKKAWLIRGVLLSTAALCTQSVRLALADLRAFGEAEGFGAAATGARATNMPTIYHVTNLNATGAGSIYAAVSAPNRIVVFDVSGVINLTSSPSVHSNITIEGQTAPGAGVIITGHEVTFGSQSNIIARYLRVRPGDSSPSGDSGINLYDANNVILDHVSVEFAKWDAIDAVTDNGTAAQVTIQDSLIADPIGQQFVAHTEALGGAFTWSNNLLANAHNRMPLAKTNTIFKNNVVYNYQAGYTTADTSGVFSHDIVNNYFITGPATTSSGNAFYQFDSKQSYYSSGNPLDSNNNGTLSGSTVNPSGGTTLIKPWSPLTATLPTVSTVTAYNFVTAHAGDSLVRDDVDNLVVSQVQTLGSGTAGTGAGTAGPGGGLYTSAASDGLENTGLGSITLTARPAGFDTDNDGIPDTWEVAHGLNPNVADSLLKDPLGYFMIEKYANELGATNDTRTWTAASGSWATAANWSGPSPSIAPLPLDYAHIRGNGTSNGAVTLASGTASAMELSIGGNGPAAGESMTVTGGLLNVYDTITVGDQNNGTLQISSSGIVQATNIILGNSIFSTTATTNYTGTLNILGGTLALAQLVRGGGTPASGYLIGGSVHFSGGILRATDDLTITAPIAFTNAPTIDTNGFNGTISSVLSGAGGFVKIGVGSLTLTGANTFTGALTLQSDTVVIDTLSNAGVAGSLGAGTDGTSLVFNGGTLQFLGSAAATTDRLFTLQAAGGTIDSSGTAPVTFAGTGSITLAGTGSRTLTLTGSHYNANGNDTFTPGITDPAGVTTTVVKSGAGRWFFSGTPKNYNGDTIINGGDLYPNATNVLPFGAGKGNVVINSGRLYIFSGSLNINALNGSGGALDGNGSKNITIGNNNASGVFLGNVQGGLNLIKTGTGSQTLSGTANAYTGTTTVNAGTLIYAHGLTTSSALAINAGAVQLSGAGNAMTTPLTIAGSANNWLGKLDIAGNALIQQSTTANKMTLLSTLQNQITSAYNHGGGWNGNGITSGLAAADPAHYSVGLFDDSLLGKTSFDNATLNSNSILIAAALIGDVNFDGHVNAADLNILSDNWEQRGASSWSVGDLNDDGVVDSLDVALLVSHWDAGTPFVALQTITVRRFRMHSLQRPRCGTLGRC